MSVNMNTQDSPPIKEISHTKNAQLMTTYYAGAVSGFCQMVVGHPLDTIKVLIQNNKSFTGLRFKDYYRGITYPIISGMFINSIVFGSYQSFKAYTENSIVSGFMAGATISPIVYFFDIGKTKRQTAQPLTLQTFYKNKGFFSSFLRESFAFSAYFSVYEYLREDLHQPIMISGALAGLSNWTFTYPLDVIRNRQMALNISMKEAIQMGSLYSGYVPCAVRALAVNAVGFYTYELYLEYANR